MAKLQINRLADCNVYLGGVSFLGRADKVTLPVIKRPMEEHKGLGMRSKIQLPTNGGVDIMEASFLWGSFYPEVLRATSDPTKIVPIQVRAAIQNYNGAGLAGEAALVIMMGCLFNEKPLGEFEKQKAVTLEDKATVYYLKVVADGEELLEIDVLNNIDKSAGVDLLSRFRSIVGA